MVTKAPVFLVFFYGNVHVFHFFFIVWYIKTNKTLYEA